MAVTYPLRVSRISTTSKAKGAILILVSVSIGLCCFPFFTLTVVTIPQINVSICGYIEPMRDVYDILHWISMKVGEFLLPTLLVWIFTALLIHTLVVSRHFRRQQTIVQHQTVKQKKDIQERQLTTTLLAIALTFSLTRLPRIILWYTNYIIQHRDIDVSVKTNHSITEGSKVSLAIYAINYATNFFFYCVFSSAFRKEMKKKFCCKGDKYERTSAYNSKFSGSRMSGTSQSASTFMPTKI